MAYVTISEADFEELWSTASTWKETKKTWQQQQNEHGRFESYPGEAINFNFKMAYWFENSAEKILAKNFLLSQGYAFQELFDNAEFHSWVLTTNYKRHNKGEPWL